MLLTAITNTAHASKFDVSVDDDTTVGDVRAIVAATLGFDDMTAVAIRLTLRGGQLLDDAQRMLDCCAGLTAGERLFVHAKAAASTAGSDGQHLRHQALNAKREEDQQRQQAKMMQPMIAAMASNPQMLQSMLQSQPELAQLVRNNPDVARELSNPETLQAMMMAQLDPDARRRMYTSMEMQLAQVNAMPGGAAMIERAMHSVTRDLDQPGRRQSCDLSEISDERARPDPGKAANVEPLPNPWAAAPPPRPQHQQAALPELGATGMPGFGDLSAFFGTGGASPAAAPAGLPPWLGGGGGLFGNQFLNAPALAPLATASSSPAAPAAAPAPLPAPPATSSQDGQGSPASPAAEAFPAQLEVLVTDMGFIDVQMCRDALRHANGDIDLAVEYIAARMPD